MTSETTPRLLGLYRRYVDADANETLVYVGFALFFTAIGLLAVALATVVWSGGIPPENIFKYELREVAGVAGALGIPLLLVSIVVLLPTTYRLANVLAAVGMLVCAVGVVQFVGAYPYNWNVGGAADRSGRIVGVYAVGAVAVITASGTSLVGYQFERVRTKEIETTDKAEAVDEDAVREQARRDVDEALSNADLSWGGVRRTETTRLKLDTSAVDDVDRSGLKNATVTETRGGSVDDAVAGLRNLRGGAKETATGEGTSDQAAALADLRKRQEADEPAGLVERLRGFFS